MHVRVALVVASTVGGSIPLRLSRFRSSSMNFRFQLKTIFTPRLKSREEVSNRNRNFSSLPESARNRPLTLVASEPGRVPCGHAHPLFRPLLFFSSLSAVAPSAPRPLARRSSAADTAESYLVCSLSTQSSLLLIGKIYTRTCTHTDFTHGCVWHRRKRTGTRRC